MVHLGKAFTPGWPLEGLWLTPFTWSWKNDTKIRQQDNFICEANVKCPIVNLTFTVQDNETCMFWQPLGPLSQWRERGRVFITCPMDNSNVNISSKVSIKCCSMSGLPNSKDFYKCVNRTDGYVINATQTVTIPLEEIENLICHNNSVIQN